MLFLGLLPIPTLSPAQSSKKPVIIAVFDSGIDETHPFLKDHLWINPGEIPDNKIDDEGNGIVDDVHGLNWTHKNGDIRDDQEYGHGTHVSGIVLGSHKKTISENITIISLKYNELNPGESLLKSLEYAEKNGVLLFNISYYLEPRHWRLTRPEVEKLSDYDRAQLIPIMKEFYRRQDKIIIIRDSSEFVNWYLTYQSDFMYDWNQAMAKIKQLQDKMLIIASVGNYNGNLNEIDLEPATLSSSNIISVMNLDKNYRRFKNTHYGSDYGNKKVLLGAVGEDVLSTVPRRVHPSGWLRSSGASSAAPKITYRCAQIVLDLKKRGMVPTPERIKRELLGELPVSEDLKRYTITGKYLEE